MEHVVLGGIDLTQSFEVLVVSRPMPYAASELQHIPGSDGYVLKGADLIPQPITLKIAMMSADSADRMEAARELAPILNTREPIRLQISDEGGLYRMVVPTGETELKEFVRSGYVTVRLQPMEAAMYGEEHTVTVPSGGSATFEVGGTYPTRPTISVSAVRDASSQVWGLRLDDGDFLHVAIGTSASRNIRADCAERTLTVGGSATIPTLDSDWLEFDPGTHTLANDQGTGQATVTWTERWL